MKQIRLITGIPSQLETQDLSSAHVLLVELLEVNNRNREVLLYLHSLYLLHTLIVWCGLGWLPYLEQGEPDVTEKHTQS